MASASVIGGAGAGLRLGDVFNRSFGLFGRLVGPFIALYVLGMIPTVVQALATQQRHVTSVAQVGWSVAIATLLAGMIGLVTHAALIDAASRTMDGEQPSVMASINVAMGRFLPLLGAWICAMIVLVIGFILLVVPGVMASVALFVMTPACVLEARGPIASLRRSAELTRGSRWRLFGLSLLLILLGGLSALAAYAARLMVGPVGGAITQAGVSAAVGLFTTIVTAVVYRDLVAAKDGFGGARMAAVFG